MESSPTDRDRAAARLAAQALAPGLREVIDVLQRAGHAAVLVGGGVRDALLGRASGDWDVATSARPEEVQRCFRRTIPTGLAHGTVTVVVGRGDDRLSVEVTTFRGEGAYLDGRHPSAVQFHDSLHDDLARRDFTVNALAFDPVAGVLHDPFDGLGDLARRSIRAVGRPAARFAEDGLRVMRAVRFCAVLGFSLDPATEAAIEGALASFRKVSAERVVAELTKLLASPTVGLGLAPMHRTGLWEQVLLPLRPERPVAEIAAALEALPGDPVLRWARLLWESDADPSELEAYLNRQRLSRADHRRLSALTGPSARAFAAADPRDVVAVRRAARACGRAVAGELPVMLGWPLDRRSELEGWLGEVPLAVGELPIGGKELVAAGLARPGPGLGRILDRLLDACLVDPSLRRPEALMALARTLAGEPDDRPG